MCITVSCKAMRIFSLVAGLVVRVVMGGRVSLSTLSRVKMYAS